jgi:hypothetical protein
MFGSSGDAPVVLCAAAHVVKGAGVVGGDAVELRERQVGEMPPRLHAVVGFVEPAIVGQQHVVLVGRIEHDVVMIDVHARHRHLGPGLSPVRAAIDVRLQRPDGFGIVGVDVNLVVVPGIAAAITVVVESATAAGTLSWRVG